MIVSRLVRTIADHLPPGGWLWMQSDVLDVAQDMRETESENREDNGPMASVREWKMARSMARPMPG